MSVKALIYDEQDRLLLYENSEGFWELPGGGIDHGESLEACVRRELQEEVGVAVAHVGAVELVYSYRSRKGYPKLCLVVPVTLAAGATPEPAEAGLKSAWYATKDSIIRRDFAPQEVGLQGFVENMWKEG